MLAFHTLYGDGQWLMIIVIALVVIAVIVLSIRNHFWEDQNQSPREVEESRVTNYWIIGFFASIIVIIMMVSALKTGNSHYWTSRAYKDLAEQHYKDIEKVSISSHKVSFGRTGCLFTTKLKKSHGEYRVYVETTDKKAPLRPLSATTINAQLAANCGI